MKGTRPLNSKEIVRIYKSFEGMFSQRNKNLFLLGVSVGGRISELLSLKVFDVWQNNKPVTDLLFDKNIVKGKEVSRAVPVNADGRKAIQELIDWHKYTFESFKVNRWLFPSRNNSSNAMTRIAAHKALKEAFLKAGVNGKLGTHSLRKSYAQRLYDETGDIYAVQEMLGHKNIATTQCYLGVNYASVREASETISVFTDKERVPPAIRKAEDNELLLELSMRGYDVKPLLENKM